MQSFLREIDRRDRVLSRAGWFQIALLALMLAAMPFDHRTILGLNPWVKPAKFAVSIAIYVWTIAWFMPYLTGPRWAKGLIRWGTTVAMVIEILCIAGQSLRGTTSHFNNATPLDGEIFSAMGLFIAFTMFLDALLLILFFTNPAPLPAAYLWGIRAGIVGILLSGAIGAMMVQQGAHSVGGSDGGPGLWIVNWSTKWGDLRASHALALHALQILPLVGFSLSRVRRLSPAAQLAALFAVVLLYGLMAGGTYWQAAQGHPLLEIAAGSGLQ